MSSIKKTKLLFLTLILFIIPLLGNTQTPAPSESAISITVTVPEKGGGGGGGGESPISSIKLTKVIFEGKAYPNAFVTVLKNGKVAATVTAGLSGNFSLNLNGISAGMYNFGIFGEDAENRKSVTLGFTINVLEGMTTTVSGIFLSPTISLSGSAVKKGSSIDIFGQAYPESEVNVFVSSPQTFTAKTTASATGKWSQSFDTSVLELGNHTTRAKALYGEGQQSAFSEDMSFTVIEGCRGSDFNFDDKIDLIDFSILLYYWGQKKPANACVDINGIGLVDLADFSIMMYWWTG